eukprot:9525860-Ditylum_brightwellii.AAC.1
MSSKYGAVPSASAVVTGDIMVEVEAPATLSAGYKFDAMYDGQTFSVTVSHSDHSCQQQKVLASGRMDSADAVNLAAVMLTYVVLGVAPWHSWDKY